ncbi:hypothetical protein QYF36_006375 [Acer negundo]|nr:hypothetical protein QYF36_006375 [Acer negundo]
MNPSKNLDQNLDEFKKMTIELANAGENEKLSNENETIILLNALPDSFKDVKATIKYGRTSLSLVECISALKSKDLELKIENKNSGENLFMRGRQSNRNENNNSNNYNKGKGRSKTPNHYRSQSRNINGTRKCYFCGKEGHIKKYCYEFKKKNQEKTLNDIDAAIASRSFEHSEVLAISTEDVKNELILDSGCSFHMTPRKDWFTEFKELSGGSVLMGDNQQCLVEGIGSVAIRMYDGMVRVFSNVRYVPNLKRNLISLGVLDEEGCCYKAEKGVLKVSRGSLVILKGDKRNSLYVLKGVTVTNEIACVATKTSDITSLWHKRLGHMSERGLNELSKQNLLNGDSVNKLEFCENCVLGKQHRLIFSTAQHNTKEILQYVHSDLWGPSKVPTHGGNQYFLSLIDDYTRKTSKKVKVLRTDNGLEFCKEEFNKFCRDHGIERHKTVRYTPQQNGVAEMMNRTILDKVRCLLISSGLNHKFWGEAVATATYLINRSLSIALNLLTSEEKWAGRPPSLKHLRVFGCAAYAHQSEGKLEPRSLRGVFLGDVIFDEDRMPCKINDITADLVSDPVEDSENKIEVEIGSQPLSSASAQSNPNEDDDTIHTDPDQVEQSQHQPEIDRESLADYELVRDRAKRIIKPNSKYAYADVISFALYTGQQLENAEPRDYLETVSCTNKLKWLYAMKEEMKSLEKNGTWSLVKKPEKQKVVACKWIFKIKEGLEKNEQPRYKVRLVAKDFIQRERIDYNEIFSPVVKYKTIRIVLALVSLYDLELEHLDVKTAFLHGGLDETIYMSQPEGFESKSKPNHVCFLKKSLYGLKQAHMQCFMLSAALSPRSIEESRFMENIPYSSAVGSVMYVMISTGPDLAQAISVLSRYIANPVKGHWNAMKWLLRYISSTTSIGLIYDCANSVVDLVGYVDSDYAGDRDKRRSTSSYFFTIAGCCLQKPLKKPFGFKVF